MMKKCIYLVSICFLVFGLIGCTCKHWDWVCTTCVKKAEPVQMEVLEEVENVHVEKVVAPIVEPAVVVAPTVVAVPVTQATTVTATGGYNFGDHKSATLTAKAWQALARKDTDAVVVYTNKCVDMYSAEAVKMQASLREYPSGDPQKIFSYWALNDTATSLFIQGEAYRKAKQMDKAKAAYERVINEFSYGQTYDVGSKTFWKPVDAARDGLYMIEKGLDLDFGDMTSQTIVRKMWESLAKKNLEEVISYDRKLEHLYGETAKSMQLPLKEYPPLPAEKIHMYWALNDVGTGMFILGEAYNIAGMKEEAIQAYKRVIADYFYAQCWDAQGWFWKPADAAQQKIVEIEALQ